MVFVSPAAAVTAWLAATPTQRLGFALFFVGVACVLLSLLLRLAREPKTDRTRAR
jgi:hypothetical protein